MSIIKGLKEFYEKAVYVWRVSKKPTQKEMKENLKIVFTGVFILGIIGFLISVIFWVLGSR